MEAARPRARRRRSRRAGTGAALDGRLVRVGLLVVVPGVVALLLALSTPGALPRPTLPPLFDAKAAGVLAGTLALEYPSRIPGTPESRGAARWYRETIGSLGIPSEEDSWTEDVAGLGSIRLTNVASVIRGRSEDTIVVVAHRDNAGPDEPAADNVSGTAALIELARSFAPQGSGGGPVPQHTLVFLSTDAGAYGGAGAARFAATSPLARRAVGAIVLDKLDLPGRPRLAIAGDAVASPPRALVGTASARVRQWTGDEPLLPSVATQLLDLAIPYAGREQGRLLGHGIPAITLTTSGRSGAAANVGVPGEFAGTRATGRMGRAAESLLDSLDSSVAASPRSRDRLYFAGRAIEGWAVRLTLVLLIVPIAVGAVDLVARARRRALPFRPALRALRARTLLWAIAVLLLGVGAVIGALPTGADLPLPPFAPVVTAPAVLRLLLLGAAFAIVWAKTRRRLVPRRRISPDERLAGSVAAFVLLLGLAFVLALLKPYALVFALPALYSWPWIGSEGPGWRGIVLFAAGLTGPALALGLLAKQVEIPLLATPFYAAGLVTVGYVSLWAVAGLVLFATAAAQFGALAFGRYAPYADGLDPPPPGVVRTTVARLARAVRR